MSATIVPGVLRLSTSDLDARPLFWNEGPLRFGYEPESAAVVADAMGLQLEWVYTDWGGRVQSVLDGEADGVWCGVSINEERRRYLEFSAPYAYFSEACVVRNGIVATSPEHLVGHRIGAIVGSTNLEMVQTWNGVIAVSFSADSSDVFNDMIEATASGHIDGFVDDEPAMVPLGDRDDRLAYAFSVHTRLPWACGVRSGNVELAGHISQGVEKCVADGTLERVWNEHLPFLEFPLGREGK